MSLRTAPIGCEFVRKLWMTRFNPAPKNIKNMRCYKTKSPQCLTTIWLTLPKMNNSFDGFHKRNKVNVQYVCKTAESYRRQLNDNSNNKIMNNEENTTILYRNDLEENEERSEEINK